MARASVPTFVDASRRDDEQGTDSDEEALQRDQSSIVATQISSQHNIQASQLQQEDVIITEAKSKKKIKLSISTRDSVVCAVCGQTGHTAGFVGAVYVDCPVKPCYLCKKPGHTAATCPFRLDPTHNIQPVTETLSANVASNLQQRESCPLSNRPMPVPRRAATWRIRSACLKLHQRRITAIDFPPHSLNLVASSCKKGLISVWDFEEVSERLSFEGIHGYQINALRFVPGRTAMSLVSASCDGHACLSDVETGMHHSLVNLNPQGWVHGVTNEHNWQMMQAVGAQHDAPEVAWAGDNRGNVYCLDLRTKDIDHQRAVHKSGKVTSIEFHPRESNLMMTAGNDHFCKLFDIRHLRPSISTSKPGMCEALVVLEHPRAISAASFSPATGRSILTTCGDNRLRLWDDVARADGPPDRELVHSHDYNRYLTPFKAVWDPKDATERTAIIGRYISEDHGGIVLHPIDILDVGTGAQLNVLLDPNLQLINPVNVPHPLLDVIITGSSGNLYCWRPEAEEDGADAEAAPVEGDGGPGDNGFKLTGSKLFSVFELQGQKQKKKANKKQKTK
eukprot:jgi/Ulvmu1/9116/UM005_0211.1